MKFALIGATGRMGRLITRLAVAAGDQLVGAVAASGSPEVGADAGELAGCGTIGVAISEDIPSALLGAEVVIDFSQPAAFRSVLVAATRAKLPLLSGTTGLSAADTVALEEASALIPILCSPNMSLGVHVLARLAADATRMLGPGFDVEIIETHHSKKTDAPSGTALRLVDAVREARADAIEVWGRHGQTGPRATNEIGVLAIRGGDVIGDHTVHLLGTGERIELTHRATDRELFARGALRAAHFLLARRAGRYAMNDVVTELLARTAVN